MKKETIYPIFLEASQYTNDKFWIYTFEKLSIGICPYGVFFLNPTTLSCKFKNKEFTYKFSDKSAIDIYNELSELLKKKCQIYSNLDHFCQIKQIENLIEDTRDQDWNQLKKKNIKECLIENYVIELQNTYNFSNKTLKKLFSHILLAFQFKLLQKTDVCYDTELGKITNINGITVNEDKTIDVIPTSDIFDIQNIDDDTEQLLYFVINEWYKYCMNISKLI
jgi:hypothetical protein